MEKEGGGGVKVKLENMVLNVHRNVLGTWRRRVGEGGGYGSEVSKHGA